MHLAQTVEDNTERTALELLTGYKRNGVFYRKHLAGHAYLPGESDVYEIKLMMLPRHTYFMRRAVDSDRYTVYARRLKDNGETKLSSAIGFGALSFECENLIEIYFPLLGRVLFLDLVPKNF